MDYSATQAPADDQEASRQVPWQIWVVVVLLGLEGVSNLFQSLDHPIALYWLSGKILFITGLLKAWKWVFVLFLVVAVQHVIVFLGINVIGSARNCRRSMNWRPALESTSAEDLIDMLMGRRGIHYC